jgi:predicted DCC family thiol-disulfide oxidoreductase YuxK
MVQIFYDMKCGFCSSGISLLQHKKNKNILNFYDLAEIKNLKLDAADSLRVTNTDSIILIENSKAFFYTEAIIRLLVLTGGFYKVLAFLMMLIPSFIRNPLYKIIARNRYCISGFK